jgi:hypothetical protein
MSVPIPREQDESKLSERKARQPCTATEIMMARFELAISCAENSSTRQKQSRALGRIRRPEVLGKQAQVDPDAHSLMI